MSLTNEQEKEALRLLARGFRNHAVAKAMGVPPGRIVGLRSRINSALQAQGRYSTARRAQYVRLAFQTGYAQAFAAGKLSKRGGNPL